MKPRKTSGGSTLTTGTTTMKQKLGEPPGRCLYCRGLAHPGEARVVLVEGQRTYIHKRHPKKTGEVPAPEGAQ